MSVWVGPMLVEVVLVAVAVVVKLGVGELGVSTPMQMARVS